jgi:ubiquinol-cytochrome c reductase cytochrome b subunit
MTSSSRFVAWLDARTGARAVLRRFLDEPIPASVGWRNTLGSLLGALLLAQILSGALLALYYVPHPEAAYASLRYVEEAIAAGGFVRALHYWGASFVVVAAFLHLVRVFYAGAYRPPRETNWLAGVALLVVIVALAFTGQLLPWNQMGYWSASVGTEIASSAPLVGPSVKRLLVGGDSLGALSLTRFYAVHVVVLPAALGLLVVIHLYLLRRHGPARPARDAGDATVPFHPRQTARDIVATSVGLLGLAIVAATLGGPDSSPADPSDTSYVPHPEWYFQSHYQVLRLTPGSLKIFATFVLPAAFFGAMLALPWLDRSSSSSLRKRSFVVGAGTLAILGVVGLTLLGILTRPGESAAQGEASPDAAAASTYDPVQAGRTVYVREDCKKCHAIGLEGDSDDGPDLTVVGLRLKEDYMRKFLANPKAFYPETEMPTPEITQNELNEVVAYLQSLTEMPKY